MMTNEVGSITSTSSDALMYLLGKSVSEIEAELTAMENDPDIQRELAAIELEFAATSKEKV